MFNLQKFIRSKHLSINILVFITLFSQCSQFILSQDINQDINQIEAENVLPKLDLSYPFKICWKLKYEESLNNTIASDNNSYLLTVGGAVKSLHSESGEKRWETDLGGEILSTPYIDGENVYIASKVNEHYKAVSNYGSEVSTDGNERNIIIRSLSISSGVTIWQTNLKTNLNPEQIFLHVYKSILLIVDKNGNLNSICKNDGILKWRESLNVKLSAPPYFFANKAILGTFEKQLVILNLNEEKTYKKVELDVIPTAIYINNNDGSFIIGDQKGIVLSTKMKKTDYEISKKEIKEIKEKNNGWKFRLGAAVSNISFTPKGLLITSLDNFAYLISSKEGNLIWKRRLTGRISDKLLVFDNYALLTTIANPIIFVLELSAGKLINEIVLEDEDLLIANPIKSMNKIIVPTSKGLYAFSSKECNKIRY